MTNRQLKHTLFRLSENIRHDIYLLNELMDLSKQLHGKICLIPNEHEEDNISEEVQTLVDEINDRAADFSDQCNEYDL